jgi:hypothetical protein
MKRYECFNYNIRTTNEIKANKNGKSHDRYLLATAIVKGNLVFPIDTQGRHGRYRPIVSISDNYHGNTIATIRKTKQMIGQSLTITVAIGNLGYLLETQGFP